MAMKMLLRGIPLILLSCCTEFIKAADLDNTTITSNINGQAIPWGNGGFLLVINKINTTTTTTTTTTPAPSIDELNPHRIVGGKRIRITKSPWTVAIIRNGRMHCGGSVIHRYWILTAAHCVDQGGNFVIRAGTRWFRSGGQTRRVRKIIKHRRFSPGPLYNDVALIKLRRPLIYTRFVKRVWLPRINRRLPPAYHATGWGLMDESHYVTSRWLRRVQVYPVRRAVCQANYRGRSHITNNMICARGWHRDTCSGDSGGPLVWNRYQYGITSFGTGCARRRFPGVYTNLRKYRSYILSVIRNN